MASDVFAASLISAGVAQPECPRLMLINACGFSPAGMSQAATDALAAADLVLHEDGIDASIAALVPSGALLEPVSARGSAVTKSLALARARRLASEGWRVVWLSSGDVEGLAADFAKAGLALNNDTRAASFANAAPPHRLATGFNGLAG